MDGVIPLSRLPEALAAVSQICKRYRFDVANVFHAGDGNLHPLILYNQMTRPSSSVLSFVGRRSSSSASS